MRTINKTIKQVQSVIQEIDLTATSEEIINTSEDRIANIVSIITQYKDANGNILDTSKTDITGTNYTLLMSANPSFAPNKPQNEYREADVWYIIDLIRNEQNTTA